MNENTKIKYLFHNALGETVAMTFTILEVEGAVGGFMKMVQKELDEMDFGKVTKVNRLLLL